MNPRARIPRQSWQAPAPGIDYLESRQLLSTILKPVHDLAPAHHHQALRLDHAAVVARAHAGHRGATPVATPAATTGLNVVTSPIVANSVLNGTAAISANDIWAVGFAAEQWNGTSWSIITTPGPGVGQLDGVTVLSDGTVVAVSNEGYIL